MAIIRNKNPVDQAFLIWANGFPESRHPLDMGRFYVFIHTVYAYHRSVIKWSDYNYFNKRVLEVKPNMEDDQIKYFYDKLLEMLLFKKFSHIPIYELDPSGIDHCEKGVKDNKIYIKYRKSLKTTYYKQQNM